MLLSNPQDAEALLTLLKEEVDAPFVAGYVSTLGGAHRPSVMLQVSLDARGDWANKIFENSRYYKIHIRHDGEVSQISRGHATVKPFRQTRAKSFEEVARKINKHLDKADK